MHKRVSDVVNVANDVNPVMRGGEAFYHVEQALSETLPIEDKEKKLIDGFLDGGTIKRRSEKRIWTDEVV